MGRSFTLVQTVTTAGVFSAVSYWYSSTFLSSVNQLFFLFDFIFGGCRYGFMFGRESARKELGDLIEDLRRGNPNSIEENQLGKSLET
ncbi:hypothetical protein POPTR_003G085400v4 [Populus trichocarpa]|jgi:hypothetical protein|uniref:Uncharacterized protein n=1 Tax=Populus trichocarpa TaxID=3694 RepID=A0ACC0T8B3_POPTR|nr:hypothetical protein BDE02_03G075200 [Populus trichocarpa]KAI9397825.1 hypothetical protein POPTR_003G085400v4 [Populus trichocarpa]